MPPRIAALSVSVVAALCLSASILMCVVSQAHAEEPANASDSGQHVFFLSDERLVVLHFNVFLDGKPQAAAWEEFLDRRFKELDADQDGMLSGDEQKGMPAPMLLAQMGLIAQNNSLLAQNLGDGKLSRDSFEGHFRRLSLEPFRLRIDQGAAVAYRAGAADAIARRSPTDDAPRVLFEKLDGDGDGRITAEDLRGASHLLRKLDLDRDESISTSELVQTANFFAVAAEPNNAQPPQPKFLMVSLSQPARAVAQQIVAALDGRNNGSKKDNRLTFDELGLPVQKLSSFDLDGDGALDFEETQQLVVDPPRDKQLIVRVGVTRGQQPIEILDVSEDGSTRQNGTLTFGKVQMELAASPSPAGMDERVLAQRFKSADQDNNGYLEVMEASRLGVNQPLFALLDADKDGKVFEKEYLGLYLPLMQMEQARVQLDIADRGRDLLRVVDTNTDGRIGPREFAAAADRLTSWDGNGDGKLASDELPQQYYLSVGRGSLSPAGRPALVATAARPMPPVRRQSAGGPQWFTKMDRNGDGDVSRREFLGPAEVFGRLDKDGNGLLDAMEAAAVAKAE